MVEATIHGIHRGTIRSDWNYHVEGHTMATAERPNPTPEMVETPVYNLVVDHPEGTILWDTGSHPEAGDGHWPRALYDAFEHADAADHPLDDALARAGYAVEEIDYVVQTHLHVDHAGGLAQFAGTDTPVFVHEAELKHAYYSAVTDEGSGGYLRADFDHDIDWRVVSRDRAQLFEDVEVLRLPGHSPGLLGTVVHLDGYGTLVFASDVAELAVNYEDERPPGAALLHDRGAWETSIRTLNDLERRHDAEIIYGHDPDQIDAVLDGWP